MSQPLKKANILVVDDTPINLNLLTEILTNHGYAVSAAKDGQEALTIARSPGQLDLILLDITMPDMDGYEVCSQLKAHQSTREIPVIFISALSDILDKVKAFGVGGVDYFTKPFQMEEVLARVQTHVALQQLQKRPRLGQNIGRVASYPKRIDPIRENGRIRKTSSRGSPRN